ncbi:MAG: hypothetical protein OXR68_07075 [Alphaproteobacteria bacterium]|nr:hypothetical protein [Alphaproteobacteria bacterium]MDD9920366.1 hypothetical protein [Alphaproteobacteria bacterium]
MKTTPSLDMAKLDKMVSVAVQKEQLPPEVQVIPFTRSWRFAGASAAAAMLMVALLWQPNAPSPNPQATTQQDDAFFVDYTMLELLEESV